MKQTAHAHRATIVNSFLLLTIATAILFGLIFVQQQKKAEAVGNLKTNFFVVK